MFIKRKKSNLLMDIREIPTTNLLGNIVGFFAPMNGGKTEAMVQELKRARYYDLNFVAYNHGRNTREKDSIVVDGKDSFPAKTVSGMDDLREDLEKRIEYLNNCNGKEVGDLVNVNGIKHHVGNDISVVGIDEINLFCLEEKEVSETINFMSWCRDKNIALYVSGLLYDFRHRGFGQVHSILPYIDIKQEKKPACMAILDGGKKCTNTAKHTQRIWSESFVYELGLEELMNNVDKFNFVNKDKKRIIDKYFPAPFFDKTLRIEEAADGRNVYLPVCTGCASLPYKEEVFQVYDAIVGRKSDFNKINDSKLTGLIVNFLRDEAWVKQNGDRELQPIPFFRNRFGSYSK